MINYKKLTHELRNAGIQISGCNALGVVWDIDNNEIQTRADVAAIIAVHDPVDYITPVTKTLEIESDALLRSIPRWATWTTSEAVTYIERNVTNLASAKTVLIAMAKLLVAMRDRTFSKIVAEERQV